MIRPSSVASRTFAMPLSAQADASWWKQEEITPFRTVNRILDGPPMRFGTGALAMLTDASVIGTAGETVVLSTVATESREDNLDSLSAALLQVCNQGMVPLTVTYQERYHGVGRIPSTARRRDNLRSTDDEILASRAIDRALRPLLKPTSQNIHVTCSVQAHNVWGTSGNPIALSLNSASVALSRAGLLKELVACVHLSCLEDGTLIIDPSPAQVEDSLCELLLAGTATDILMMECCSPTDRIKEEALVDLMRVAHSALEPILEIQSEMSFVKEEESDDRIMRLALGLPPLEVSEESDVTYEQDAKSLFTEAYQYCHQQRKDSSLRLFGYTNDRDGAVDSQDVSVHPFDQPLLSKAERGRREHIVFTEIQRILKEEFQPQDERLKEAYQSLVEQDSESLSVLARAIHQQLLKEALQDTATKYKSRGDCRGGENNVDGCRVVRPIYVTVPALPDVVHGSAVFARGDTQVLCTTTLGAPMDGIPKTNPYQETTDPLMAGSEGKSEGPKGPYDDLPVGSLRYLRSQEALVSDMNSRKVKADRELTGDSGTFDEVCQLVPSL